MEARRSNPWLWPVLAIVLVVGVVALPAVVMSPYGGYYGMMGGGAGWGIAMMAMMLVPLVVLVLLVLLFAGALSPRGVPVAYVPAITAPTPAGSALEILDARYARGEISQDEYLRIKSDLTGGGGKPA
jgi:putative membrane protein